MELHLDLNDFIVIFFKYSEAVFGNQKMLFMAAYFMNEKRA